MYENNKNVIEIRESLTIFISYNKQNKYLYVPAPLHSNTHSDTDVAFHIKLNVIDFLFSYTHGMEF